VHDESSPEPVQNESPPEPVQDEPLSPPQTDDDELQLTELVYNETQSQLVHNYDKQDPFNMMCPPRNLSLLPTEHKGEDIRGICSHLFLSFIQC